MGDTTIIDGNGSAGALRGRIADARDKIKPVASRRSGPGFWDIVGVREYAE